MNFLFELVRNMALASVPAVGFALVFNVPARILKFCALGGALGFGLRFGLIKSGIPIEWATLLTAGVVSFWGVWCAQRLRAHPKVFTVAAMIPMVPGVPFFTTLLALVEIQNRGYAPELMETAVSAAIKTLLIVNALAVGLALPGLLLYRRKPVV